MSQTKLLAKMPGMLSAFKLRKKTIDHSSPTIDRRSLRSQIAALINTFLSVRGLAALLDRRTGIVMRKHYEAFISQNIFAIENPETIVAIVRVMDMECCEQFTVIQADSSTRSSPLGKMAPKLTVTAFSPPDQLDDPAAKSQTI